MRRDILAGLSRFMRAAFALATSTQTMRVARDVVQQRPDIALAVANFGESRGSTLEALRPNMARNLQATVVQR